MHYAVDVHVFLLAFHNCRINLKGNFTSGKSFLILFVIPTPLSTSRGYYGTT